MVSLHCEYKLPLKATRLIVRIGDKTYRGDIMHNETPEDVAKALRNFSDKIMEETDEG